MILWKHPAMRTVAFQILNKKYMRDEDKFSLRLSWWDIGECHPPRWMGVIEEIQLPRKKVEEFEEYKYVQKSTQVSVQKYRREK